MLVEVSSEMDRAAVASLTLVSLLVFFGLAMFYCFESIWHCKLRIEDTMSLIHISVLETYDSMTFNSW